MNDKLITFRTNIRSQSKEIIDTLIADHKAEICCFCGSSDQLIKEHVIPKWAFENNPKKDFVTNINNLNQKYSHAVIPACFDCNSVILGSLEKHIKSTLSPTKLSEEHFDISFLENLILWIDLIDYKFQVLDLRRTFKKVKGADYIPYLAEIPVSILQHEEQSSYKVHSCLRGSLKRLCVKSKLNRIDSLITFKTSNEGFHFFHKADDFFFIELPKQETAIFCFLKNVFDSNKKAHEGAMKIIEKIY